MPVMANDAGRLDIGFARGARFSWSARWEQSLDGGRSYMPVDLTGWDCVARLYDAYDSLILEKPCTGAANGLATCVLEAGDTLGPGTPVVRRGALLLVGGRSGRFAEHPEHGSRP